MTRGNEHYPEDTELAVRVVAWLALGLLTLVGAAAWWLV